MNTKFTNTLCLPSEILIRFVSNGSIRYTIFGKTEIKVQQTHRTQSELSALALSQMEDNGKAEHIRKLRSFYRFQIGKTKAVDGLFLPLTWTIPHYSLDSHQTVGSRRLPFQHVFTGWTRAVKAHLRGKFCFFSLFLMLVKPAKGSRVADFQIPKRMEE